MNKLFLKIASFSLALLVLISTFSFTVDKHYCGDFLVDISFTGEAEGCGMHMEKESLPKKKGCCKDEVQKFEGQDKLQNNKIENITFKNQEFLAVFCVSYKDIFIDHSSEDIFFKDFSPPDIPFDYQVLYQTFLI
tara:strand:- start:58171 stop:58575 length:405 start_codon:yes stop_codon:yes gene_type:complete